jgi:hypothetical protein
VSDSCLAWLRALYSESVVRSKLTFYPGTLHSQCSSLILQRFKPLESLIPLMYDPKSVSGPYVSLVTI